MEIILIVAVSMIVLLIVALMQEKRQVKKLKELIEAHRLRDSLTSLYNQVALLELGKVFFASAKRQRKPIAALFIDLDNFKKINDQLGHNTGDKILIDFASILNTIEGIKRRVDIISRNGGDEFVVVLVDADETHAKKVRKQISDKFIKVFDEFVTDPNLFDLSFRVSVGIAVCNPKDEKAPRDFMKLLKRADLDMYKIKHLRKDIEGIKLFVNC